MKEGCYGEEEEKEEEGRRVLRDRYRGCVVGCACGDALGAAVEFKPRGTFREVVSMRGGGPFHVEKGEWTDDTAMLLCVCHSLIECGGSVLTDQLSKFLKWRQLRSPSHSLSLSLSPPLRCSYV